MQDTKVSNIEEIGKLTNLEELNLSSTNVKSIAPLAGYANYTYAGMPIKLHDGLKKLNTLKLYGLKQITGYKLLKEKLPNLAIKISPGTKID